MNYAKFDNCKNVLKEKSVLRLLRSLRVSLSEIETDWNRILTTTGKNSEDRWKDSVKSCLRYSLRWKRDLQIRVSP